MLPSAKNWRLLLSGLFLLLGLSNNPAIAETPVPEHAQNDAGKLKASGLYFGFFPCADCQGVKTTLALNANNSYVLITQYVGKSDREFVEKGKFAVGDDGKTLVLSPKKGGIDTQQYLIDDEMLIKLDENGERITADGADRFILRRKDVISSKQKHGGH